MLSSFVSFDVSVAPHEPADSRHWHSTVMGVHGYSGKHISYQYHGSGGIFCSSFVIKVTSHCQYCRNGNGGGENTAGPRIWYHIFVEASGSCMQGDGRKKAFYQLYSVSDCGWIYCHCIVCLLCQSYGLMQQSLMTHFHDDACQRCNVVLECLGSALFWDVFERSYLASIWHGQLTVVG